MRANNRFSDNTSFSIFESNISLSLSRTKHSFIIHFRELAGMSFFNTLSVVIVSQSFLSDDLS